MCSCIFTLAPVHSLPLQKIWESCEIMGRREKRISGGPDSVGTIFSDLLTGALHISN